MGGAIGGFGVGFIEKTWGDKIPAVPYIGRKGAIALAIYFWNPKSTIAKDIGVAAAVLSGYELARDGSISGEDWDDQYEGDDDDDFFVTT